jgi:ribosomal protein S18 acetylase RimI-like enzyme
MRLIQLKAARSSRLYPDDYSSDGCAKGRSPQELADDPTFPPLPDGRTMNMEDRVGSEAHPRFTGEMELRVRRIHRRDLDRVWRFLKRVFRDVNRETVEYQRPRLKKYFYQIYEDESVEQLLFELKRNSKYDLVGYAEFAYEIAGTDNWMNQRYFEKRGMRPLFVDELAVHPDFHNMGIGSFMYEQVEHAARLRGCTHIVLEVAENNKQALTFYRARNFFKLDAAIFLARKLEMEKELLPPRTIRQRNSGLPRPSPLLQPAAVTPIAASARASKARRNR